MSAIIENWRYQYLFKEIFNSIGARIKWINDIFKWLKIFSFIWVHFNLALHIYLLRIYICSWYWTQATQLYDKRDYFNFSIFNFPYLCSNIPTSSAYDVYISQLIRYARDCSTFDQFLVWGSLLTKSWCCRGFNSLICRQLSANFMVVTTILFANATFLWATCCLIRFIPIVNRSLIMTTVRTVYLIWK
jgi:hypothetical protein